MDKKTYLNWSSGKDAAMALYELQQNKNIPIHRLVTTINGHYNRVSMHGLSIELLQKQVKAIGLPLETIPLPENPSMEMYSQIMDQALHQLQSEGFQQCGFGDIFLEDLKVYREQQLQAHRIKALFPLWQLNTTDLIHRFLSLGFKAIIICINAQKLDESFIGREIDEQFLKDLPADVDPCGENGEFHTFCYDGPIFQRPVEFSKGEKVFQQYAAPKEEEETSNKKQIGFWFLDLLA